MKNEIGAEKLHRCPKCQRNTVDEEGYCHYEHCDYGLDQNIFENEEEEYDFDYGY